MMFKQAISALFIATSLPAVAGAQDICATDSWGAFLAPDQQTFERRELIANNGDIVVMAFEFGELKGEYAKVWLFARFDGDCMVDAVSLGSYAYLLDPAKPDAPRQYHLDYYAADTHATLGFYDTKPTYQEIRAEAVAALAHP